MEYIEMKKEIDRLMAQNKCLKISLARRNKEVEKFKKAFEGSEYCNQTLYNENRRLNELIEDLNCKISILKNVNEIQETIKEQENGTKI